MHRDPADALVFYGATGDLAYKKIFPALQAMARRNHLDIPIIGVAKAGWNLQQFLARARDSVETHGGLDPDAFEKLSKQLRYVDGDYADEATFAAVRRELGDSHRPAHYMAIPPSLFGLVVNQLVKSGCDRGARVIVEKPFGRSLASARELNATLLEHFPESAIFRIDHYLGKEPVQNIHYFRFANSFLEPIWNRNHIAGIEITMAENFGVQGRGAFYEQAGAIRDVVQNHLFQILANLTMEPPAGTDSESIRDEKAKVLKAICTLTPADVVRGQFRGYRDEPGVSPQSQVETFAVVKLEIHSWRWQGVPIYIRAGKALPVTCTEVVVRFRPPPAVYESEPPPANLLRFRVSPDVIIGLRTMVKSPGERMAGRPTELVADQRPTAEEMDPYERLLGDALKGDATQFAREDYVEEAWRIVEPVLGSVTPLHTYEPGTWGPAEAACLAPTRGWHTPHVSFEPNFVI